MGRTRSQFRRVRFRLLAVLTGLVALIAPVVVTAPAAAAGTGVLTISMEPVSPTSGQPQTWAGATGLSAGTDLGYRITYSCSNGDCLGTTLTINPAPTDPTYGVYRHLVYRSWTAPFTGATISGNTTTGLVVTLGDLVAGTVNSFQVNLGWSYSGNANTNTIQPAQFFPNGYQIVMSATAASSSITNEPAATAAPVEWRSTIRDPAVAISNPGSRDSDTNVSYSITMNSGCLPIRDTAPKGDSRFTCAKSYVVTDTLDPRATFVSATGGGVYDPVSHTVTWTKAAAAGLQEPAAGWYAPGNSNVHNPRTVVVSYPAAAFSESGDDDDYCNFTQSVTSVVSMTMVFLGSGGMSDDTNVRELSATRTHDVSCVRPFAKAIFNHKATTYDGPNRYGNGNSPIVVQPDADPNQHRWDISVGNQANVPGVAVIEEPNLAIEGTKPYQIQATNGAGTQQNNATIAWTLNTGATGTSMGVADAPTGTWFTAATVTSGPLAGPNLYPTQSTQTTFLMRVRYNVAADAPIGQVRTNTVTASMTYPSYPELSPVVFAPQSHSVQYSAPFGRGTFSKSSSATGGAITIPSTGSTNHYWSILVANTGNVPGVAVIDDVDLTGPAQVRTVSHNVGAPNVTTGASVAYTLNTGATGTAAIPFTAPTGTWITSARVTSPILQPVNALSTQNVTTSTYEVRFGFAVTNAIEDGATWTNTASTVLTYPNMGIASVDLGDSTRTITFGDAPADTRARITAAFVGTGVVDGGGQAVPGRNVTYTVRATTSNVDTAQSFSPQYLFVAPVNWAVVPGSAAFAEGAVPAGVSFQYKTVTVAGVERQAVLASWPAGVSFGQNVTWPSMTVSAQPTFSASPGTSGIAQFWAGEASNNWSTTDAVYSTAITDSTDVDGDGVTTEGFAYVNATGVAVGSASGMNVIKEICYPDEDADDGCEWISDPTIVVGVDPAATDISYRVRLVNTGNTILTTLVAYDVLPHPGDVGTSSSLASTPRGSTFQEALNEVVATDGVVLAYSDSTDPCRPEVFPGGPTGCSDTWSADADALDGAQSIRVTATDPIAPGDEVSFQYTARVVPGAAADAIACNSIAAKADQFGVPNEPLPVCATTQEADLELSVPERLPLQAGRPGVLPFLVTNNGGSVSAPAFVDVEIPSGVRVVNLAPDGWSCTTEPTGQTGPLTLLCASDSPLELGTPKPLEITVVPDGGTSVCFDGAVHGRMSDPDPDNNDAQACFVVAAGAPELVLDKTDERTSAMRGDEFTYTLTLRNGLVGEALSGIVLTDELPAALEFVSASDGGTEEDGVVTWPAIDLAASGLPSVDGDTTTGSTASTITRTVTVRVRDAAGAAFTNEARAEVVDPATGSGMLSAEASDTDDLLMYSVAKHVDAAPEGVYSGDVITYTVVVINDGTAPFPAASIWDDLSDVLDDGRFVAGSGSVTVTGEEPDSVADPVGGILTWTGTLPVGGSATISYDVEVEAGGDGMLGNAVFTSAAGSACAAGQDEVGSPCATTTTYFGPVLSKTVVDLQQAESGQWSIVYDLEVVNRNPDVAVEYSLSDSLEFGAGIDVLSAAVDGPVGLTIEAWDGSGAIIGTPVELPAGDTHHYTVTVDADAHAIAGTAAAGCIDGTAGGFANSAALTLASGRVVRTETCAEPTEPTIVKTANTVAQNSDRSWEVSYSIVVSAEDAPTGGLTYTIDDAIDFPAGATVTDVVVSGPGDAPLNPDFDGASDTALLDGADRVMPNSTREFEVTFTVSAVAGSVVGSDLACAPAGLGGYANSVTLLVGTSDDVTGEADACANTLVEPTPQITKSVAATSIDGDSGDWTITYDIVVANPSALYATSYDLADELQFGDGISIVDASVSSADGPTSATWDGRTDTVVAADVELPASGQHTYTIVVVAVPPLVIDDDNAAAMDCRLDTGETGTGYRNLATLDSGVVSPSPIAVGCEPATDPSVVKTVVAAPTQDAASGQWTVEYEITVTNRSTSTVPGGVPYSLSDGFAFPHGVDVVSVGVTGPGAVNDAFDGDEDTELASGAIEAAVDESTPAQHVYTVTVVFTMAGGIPALDRACSPTQGAGGMRNEIEISVGVRTTGDVACADLPEPPVMGVAKSVLSQTQQDDGTWVVLYRVTVANPSLTVSGFYDLADEFALGEGMELVGSPSIVARPADVSVLPGWNGDTETTLVEGSLLGVGATHQYTVRATIDSGSVRSTDPAADCTVADQETGSGFLNTVTVDSGLQFRSAEACASVVDPSITKTVDGSPVRNSDGSWTVAYVITVSNPSATVEVAYELRDELDFPEGTVFDSVAVSTRSLDPAASETWDGVTDTVVVAAGASLPGGAVHVFDVTVTATLPSGQQSLVDGFANSAVVATGVDGAVMAEADAAADIELPSLTIEKVSDATGVLEIGDEVTYTITVTNTGIGDFTASYPAEVWDDLVGVLDDADIDAAPSVSPDAGTLVTSADSIHWSGALLADESIEIVYTVVVTGEGDQRLANVAYAGAPGETPETPADCQNPLCASTSTDLAGFFIEKSVSTGVAAPGDTVEYTIVYTNTGLVDVPDAAFGDDLSDILDDAELTGSPSATSGTVTVTEGVLAWWGALSTGESVTVTYSVTVRSPLTGDGMMSNTANADPRFASRWPGGECPDDTEDCGAPAGDSTTATGIRSLAFTKSADAAHAAAGARLVYTITVKNIGSSDYTELSPATVVDSMGGVLDDASYNGDAVASAGEVAFADGQLAWTGALEAGQSVTVTYSVTVNYGNTGNGRLENVIGLTAADAAGVSESCLDEPTDNAQAHCVVSVVIAPLAFTGFGIPVAWMLVAVVLILAGFAFVVFVLRRRNEEVGRTP